MDLDAIERLIFCGGYPVPLLGTKLAPLLLCLAAMSIVLGQLLRLMGSCLDLPASLRWRIYDDFSDSVFDPTGNKYAKIEANALKRGAKNVSFCKLELIPSSQPRACNPIGAVGIKEEGMTK